MDECRNTLSKPERLNSRKAVQTLFDGNSRSCSVFPLRAVYRLVEEKENCPVSILVSVSKRRFKHAVDRNRVKRQIREAYRRNKHRLSAKLAERHTSMHLAFIYLGNELRPYEELVGKLTDMLDRITERLEAAE